MLALIVRRICAGRAPLGGWTPLFYLWPVAVMAIGIMLFAPAAFDGERYWYSVVGHDILRTGTIPQTLGRLTFFPNNRWIPQEWLVSVATAWTLDHGIFWALIVLEWVVLSLSFIYFVGESIRARVEPCWSTAGAIIWIVSVTGFAQLRAAAVTIPCFALLVLLRRRRSFLTSTIVMCLWANLHGSFALGICWLLLQLRRRGDVLPTLLAIAATLLTPLGPSLWVYPVTMATNSAFHRVIQEWTPTFCSIDQGANWMLYMLAFAFPLVGRWRLRRQIDYRQVAIAGAVLAASIDALRFTPLFIALFAPWLQGIIRPQRPARPANAWALMMVAVLVAMLVTNGHMLGYSGRLDRHFDTLEVPNGVPPSIATRERGRRLFVDDPTNASYMESQGAIVSIDGRFDAYDQGYVVQVANLLGARRVGELLTHSQAQDALLFFGEQPDKSWRLLRSGPHWKLYTRLQARAVSSPELRGLIGEQYSHPW